MTALAQAALLAGIIGPACVFAGYPAFIALLAFVFPKKVKPDPAAKPEVTVITAARNAEALVKAKVENTLAQDYPADRLRMIVASDGSTDATAAIARQAGGERVAVVELDGHRGKIAALNAALELAPRRGVIVFSDADALLAPDAVSRLAAVVSAEGVGGACGQRVLESDAPDLADAQRGYVGWDSAIKRLESRHGSLTSSDGKCLAVRAELLEPIPEAVTDDLWLGLMVVKKGLRFVFEPGARAVVPTPSRSPGHEIVRRRRIVAQSLRGLSLAPGLLAPWRGAHAVGLLVNKGMRRLLPVFLLLLLFGSVALRGQGALYEALLAAQLAGYGLAVLYPPLKNVPVAGKLSRMALYFCLGNLGMLWGLADFLRGRKMLAWDPRKSEEPVKGGARRIAYVMSRFPKITETFVLYEIIEIEKQGLEVEIFPLLREREAVAHPEALRMMPKVRYSPFVNGPIMGANLYWLFMRPGAYISALCEAMVGTLGSWNLFTRALAIFPKSAWMAREFERLGIVHVHAHFATHPTQAALYAHRLSGVPFSFTAHAHDIQMHTEMLAQKAMAAEFVAAISEFNRERIIEVAGEDAADSIHVVRCGVDPGVFNPPDRGKRKTGRTEIVCVAAFRDMKGHRHLVDACALLVEKGYDFRCRLVGEGPLRSDVLQRVVGRNLRERVVILGPRPRLEVVGLLAESDIAVLPSVVGRRGDMEGIPVALMEAMAMELPVVSSRLSGIPELIEDSVSGLLVPPGDPEALAQAMRILMDNPDLGRALGKAGRARVLAEYDLRQNAAQLAGLIKDAAGRGGRRGRD